MEQSFKGCLSFLQKKHVKVQREWLQACLEWIIEENGSRQSTTDLCNLVYEQWLMADLTEIADASFPNNLKNLKGNLNGNFCVQMNSFMDIGHSSYSQLQKLKGIEMDYDETEDGVENEAKEFFKKSSEEAKLGGKSMNTKKWNEMSSRMLWFQLHDGVQEVEAIEYTPINHLKMDELEPGCKVQLVGPMMCRDNIILLKAENIRILGGNVESLMETKTQMKLLSSKLSLENDNKPTTSTANKNNNRGRQQSTKQQQPVVTNVREQNTRKDTSTKPKSRQSRTLNNPPPPPPLQTHHQQPDNDDFLENFDNDDDIFFQDVDVDVAKSSITDNQSQRGKTSSIPRRNDDVISRNDDVMIDDEDFFGEDDDMDIFEELQPEKDSVAVVLDDPPSSPKATTTTNLCTKYLTVSQMISQARPLTYSFQVKAANFKTLASRMSFDDGYRVFAILADAGKDFLKVLVGNSALLPLIGYEASAVRAAVANKVPKQEKAKIKKALQVAEKALELNKWCMTIEFNQVENIYEVVAMLPSDEIFE